MIKLPGKGISETVLFLSCISVFSLILYSCSSSQKPNQSTYCNPLNLDYTYSNVNTSTGLSYRSGADPTVVKFKGEYFLFMTRSGGYWHSKDLGEWEFIRPQSWYFEFSNAPTAWSYKDSILIALGNPAQWQCVIYTNDPVKGTWKDFPSIIPHEIYDPALFVDEDNRVYLYENSSNLYPVMGVELDPKNYFLPIGDFKELLRLDPKKHGWERFGEDHSDSVIAGYIEGSWMTKHNGKYYLQYAAPGTEWNVYGDGVYISDSPLGPFIYAENNPFSYKPGGFIRGAGHGSTVQDLDGNYWHFGTMVVGINYKFERRIGMFPTGFDKDDLLFTNTAYGDYPHYLPSAGKNPDAGLFTGWMLLSYNKPVKSSTVNDGFIAANAVDENIKSFWAAESNSKKEWLSIDLKSVCEVEALQIDYSDYKSNIFGKPDTIYHQYLIEYSFNEKDWDILVDKRENKKDVPNDYVELQSTVKTRFIRFRNFHFPTPYLALSELRIFGKGSGDKPVAPSDFTVVRGKDRRTADLKWAGTENAQGYVIYFGIARDKLYNSVMIYKDSFYRLNSLNTGPHYFFAIEAFNENGISSRTGIIEAE
jgi:hypothetical protein